MFLAIDVSNVSYSSLSFKNIDGSVVDICPIPIFLLPIGYILKSWYNNSSLVLPLILAPAFNKSIPYLL